MYIADCEVCVKVIWDGDGVKEDPLTVIPSSTVQQDGVGLPTARRGRGTYSKTGTGYLQQDGDGVPTAKWGRGTYSKTGSSCDDRSESPLPTTTCST